MANGVSVTSEAVSGGIACCTISMQELGNSARVLNQKYQAAGAGGWADSKYRDLGTIVSECCNALNKPISDLNNCKSKLQDLLKAVREYEATRV